MRVLITGIRGFLGRHLAELMHMQGASVVGLSRHRATDLNGAECVAIDLLDRTAVRDLVATGFDVIFHLAFANSSADRLGDAMIMTAVRGTENLLEAIRAATPRPRTVLVSSAAVYGWATTRAPLTEQVAPQPMAIYGTLKLAQEMLAASYRTAFGFPLVTLRPFNLLGPGERGAYVAGALAMQIVARERGEASGVISAGYLGNYRDFVDVRDVARACWLAAEKGSDGGVYNVCSGRAVQVRELAERLQRCATVPVEIVGQAEAGAFDLPYHCGDGNALRAQTGWTPQIALDQSLRDLLADLRTCRN